MRIIYAIILALILAFPALAQRTPKTITADVSTSALLWPTNLWDVERDNIYSSLGLWAGATNQTAAAFRSALGLSENTTNTTAAGWRSAIGVGEISTNTTAVGYRAAIGANESITNTTPAGFRLAYEISDIATNTLPANWRAAIGVSEIATNLTAAGFRSAIGVSEFSTNTTASGWRSALAVPANSGGFLTNATISGNSTFVGAALSGSTYTVATNAGVELLDSIGDRKLAIVDGRVVFNDNWPVIVDATDAFFPRYSVAVSNTAPSAGAILNRGTADYRYGIPTTFSKTGLVQAASSAVARAAIGLSAGSPGAIGTNLLVAVTAADARTMLGIGSGNIVSVSEYGAVPNDGISDFDSIEGAAYEAMTTGKVLWIPRGTFDLEESDVIELWADIRIDGAGDEAIIRHAGESAATATETFRLTSATNVTISNIQLQNARYAVSLRQALPTAGKLRLDNVRWAGCRVGVYYNPPDPWSIPEQIMASLELSRCSFTGVSTTTSAGVDLRNPAIDMISIEKSQFTGGQYGVSIQGYQMPTNQIPQQLSDHIVIRSCTFTGQDHASSAHNGVFVSGAQATVEECVFRDGSKGGSSSTDQAAVRLMSQLGKVHRCRFIRWGNNTDKPITVMLTGPGTEIDQFIGPTLNYNYDPGWFATLSESYFEDLYTSGTTTGCGRVYIESDDARIENNIWEKCYLALNPAVYWKTTTPYTTFSRRIRVVGNQLKVCNLSANFFYMISKSENVYISNNNAIGCEGTGGYLASLDNSSSDVTVIDNQIQDSPNFSLLKLSTFSSAYTHTGVSVIRNTLTNCLYGVATTSGSSGNSGFVTNLVMEANRMWSVNSPLYILNYVTVADSRISDNFVSGAANAIPRLGTSPAFVNTEIFGNGVSLTTRRMPFLGSSTTAPSYPVIGGTWLSNTTVYYYSGSVWLPLN